MGDDGGCDYVAIGGSSENWMDSGQVFLFFFMYNQQELQMDGI